MSSVARPAAAQDCNNDLHQSFWQLPINSGLTHIEYGRVDVVDMIPLLIRDRCEPLGSRGIWDVISDNVEDACSELVCDVVERPRYRSAENAL